MKKEYKKVIKWGIGIYFFFYLIGFVFIYFDTRPYEATLFNIADRDAHVDSNNPTVNDASEIWVSAGSYYLPQEYEAYFHFVLNDKPSFFKKIELSLSILNEVNPTIFNIILVGNSWQENTLNWLNKPSHQSIIKNITLSSAGVYKIDLTDFLKNLDEVSFCVNKTNSTVEESVSFSSKEGYVYEEDAPMIIWTYESGFTPPILIGFILIYIVIIISLTIITTKVIKFRMVRKRKKMIKQAVSN